MKVRAIIILLTALTSGAAAQTNIVCTNPAAESVMLGNYDPSLYQASSAITDPGVIASGINTGISPDSLHAILEKLATFKTRNSGSDTVSAVTGIGAARKWIYSKFLQYSTANGNRLQPFYLRFDQSICGIVRHKNVCAALPGTDTSLKDIVIIEAHFDTRCQGLCDTACVAEGMEDNGSGTALVMELARVMSKYSFRRTIVFAAVTAEEQGLLGANALAAYAVQKAIKIRAVMNNDVVGGVICGNTASPPSCSPAGDIDSTNVRLFSAGVFNSPHKQLARFIKLEYKEMIQPIATVGMSLHIMTPEDRSGRGGDHIPFRQMGFNAMRFTSANEHGDAGVTSPWYVDRQHTSDDILGVDTDADMQIDSFFVDFNYLARNAVINGNAAAMAAMGPVTPDFYAQTADGVIYITVTKQTQHPGYRLAVRSSLNDWDTVYPILAGPVFTLTAPAGNNLYLSVASVDNKQVESLFSAEKGSTDVTGIGDDGLPEVELLQNQPNPFDEATAILVKINGDPGYRSACVEIHDIAGKLVKRYPVTLTPGIHEVIFSHGFGASGTYFCSLVADGRKLVTRKMVLQAP